MSCTNFNFYFTLLCDLNHILFCSAARTPVFQLVSGRFWSFFCPTRKTRCSNCRRIWYGRCVRRASFHVDWAVFRDFLPKNTKTPRRGKCFARYSWNLQVFRASAERPLPTFNGVASLFIGRFC